MKDNRFKFKSFWLPLFIFAIAVICFYKVVDKLPEAFSVIGQFIEILLPFVVGIVIAFILHKPTTKMEGWFKKSKKKFVSSHGRGIAVLISYTVFFTIIIALLYLILPKIFSSVVSLINDLPKYYKQLIEYISNLAGNDGMLFGYDVSKLSSEGFNLSGLLSFFNFETVKQYLGEIFKATGVIVDLVMAFVVSIYMLLDTDHLIKVCGKLARMIIPERRVIKLYRFMSRSCDIFYNYIYSQLLDALIVAVICFVIFTVLGIPYGLLLALLMGICNLIPYFGAIMGGAGVAFVTLISTGSILRAFVTLACVIIAQQLDANVIQPRIVASSLGLKPIYVLLAIVIGGGLFGFFGILLGVPIMAVIRMLLLDYMEDIGDGHTPLVRRQEKLRALKKAKMKNRAKTTEENQTNE